MENKQIILTAIEEQIAMYKDLLQATEWNKDYRCNLCKYTKKLTFPHCMLCPWNLCTTDVPMEFKCEDTLLNETQIESFTDIKKMLFSPELDFKLYAKRVVFDRIETLQEWFNELYSKPDTFFIYDEEGEDI